MLKSFQNRHHHIFLQMLRSTRESAQLRQLDLAQLLGGWQGSVSKVESGGRRLDVIELRTWLDAMGVDFLHFMSELDQRLREQPVVEPRFSARKKGAHGTVVHTLDAGRRRR